MRTTNYEYHLFLERKLFEMETLLQELESGNSLTE